jgi:hypothetical protein
MDRAIHGLVTVPGFLLLDQSDNPAPLYSVKGVHYLGLIENGKQTFHRSLRVPTVFSQDAPSVLNGSNERILVGIVHDSHSPPLRIQERPGRFVPAARCRMAQKIIDPSPASGGPIAVAKTGQAPAGGSA